MHAIYTVYEILLIITTDPVRNPETQNPEVQYPEVKIPKIRILKNHYPEIIIQSTL